MHFLLYHKPLEAGKAGIPLILLTNCSKIAYRGRGKTMARNPLIVKLWGVLESEDPNSVNAQIAKILIKNRLKMEHTSSSYLAKLCDVSKPSLSRFSRLLGYEDFLDFRADLKGYVPDRGRRFTATIQGESDNPFDNYKEYICKILGLSMIRNLRSPCRNW